MVSKIRKCFIVAVLSACGCDRAAKCGPHLPSSDDLAAKLQQQGWVMVHEDDGGEVVYELKDSPARQAKGEMRWRRADGCVVRIQFSRGDGAVEPLVAEVLPNIWSAMAGLPDSLSEYSERLGKMQECEVAPGVSGCIFRHEPDRLAAFLIERNGR